jgi:hypothetical protein
MITLAYFVVVTQYADFVDDVSQSVFVIVRASFKRSRYALHGNRRKGRFQIADALIENRLSFHVVNFTSSTGVVNGTTPYFGGVFDPITFVLL